MITRSIANMDLLKLIDENKDCIYYGCDQEWYPEKGQRETGCGPTTACNILFYLKYTDDTLLKKIDRSKNYGLSLMEETWKYITPTENGIPSAEMFCQHIHNYAELKDIGIVCNHIDIPKERGLRPDIQAMLQFIDVSLIDNFPVAFLNLCNGEVCNLDRWHWTTIISLEYSEDYGQAYVDIIDGGTIKRIDLALWYKTTLLGGGFVRISTTEKSRNEFKNNCMPVELEDETA